MSLLRRTVFLSAALSALVCLPVLAQPAADTNSPEIVKSPVAIFRELLAMTPDERQAAIAIRPPDIQKRILEKLQEYQLYPTELREQRLQETELRWYLRPLMDEPKTNRAALLARIPEPQRSEVEQRLSTWDLLPPQLQDQFKHDDTIANYFAQMRTAEDRTNLLAAISPERRRELEQGLDRWQHMSEDQRQNALFGFNKFFELTPEEKEKTLDTISDEERQEMDKTLSSYAQLTPVQRAQCIRSFEKFAKMSIVERQQFLNNAERWREMTPEERQKWRELVNVAPIMPILDTPTRRALVPRSFLRTKTSVATN